MRNLLPMIGLIATSCALSAQTNPSSWDNLRTLAPGQKIQVVEITAKKSSGAFVNVSDSAIVFTQANGNRTLQKQDVRSVKLMKTSHRLRNTLIAAGIGAGAGAGITAGAWESNGFLGGKGAGAAVGAVIGGVAGAIVGAVLPSHNTLYSASSR
jgi:hypothetical protein